MTKPTWSQEHNNILLEYCSKKISLKEIAIALDRKIGDVKYHIRDLAVADFINGISKQDLLLKYNLTMHQLNDSINKVTESENKLKEKTKSTTSSTNNTRTDITYNTRSKNKDNKDNNETKNINTNRITNEDVFIVIELLKEIRDILKNTATLRE